MTCELRLSAGSCVYTNASIRLFAFSSLIDRVAVDAPTSTVLRKEGPQGSAWCSRVIFKVVQKRSTYTWPGLARGRTRLPKQKLASTLSSWNRAEHDTCKIPASADWCLSQRACGRQRAIRCLKVRSFWRGTNLFPSTSWTCQHVVPNLLAQ